MYKSSYKWHPMKGGEVWFAGALALSISAVCLIVGFNGHAQELGSKWPLLGFGLVFGLVGLATFIDRKVCVTGRGVRCDALLLGRLRLWSRPYPFSAFNAVVVQRSRDREVGRDTYLIGLQRRNGRKLWVCYNTTEALAKSCARRLCSDTGLSQDGTKR